MANEKQRRAFISYSRVNKEFASKLSKDLRTAGYSIWFDLFDIPTGSRWDDEVEKALRECSIFMVILTPASIASENVKDEIGYAIDHGKRILPVLLEDCDVPLRLRRFQYVDFTTKNFEEGFASAKELLGDLIEEASMPVPAKTPVSETKIDTKVEEEQAAKAKAETERKAKNEADRLAAQKAKAAQKDEAMPVPAMRTEIKAETVSIPATQKKSMSKGLVIGIVAVVVLCIAGIGIGFSALSNRGTPATEVPYAGDPATEAPVAGNPATEAPVVAEPATEAPVVAIPTTGPIALNTISASEASKLYDSAQHFSYLAREKYGDAQYDSMADNGTPFEIENPTSEPLLVSRGWCSTTQTILEENLANMDVIFEFNGQRISDNNIASFDFAESDGWACRRYFIIVDNWSSGTYSVYGTLKAINPINDGQYDYVMGTLNEVEYIVSIP